MHGHGGHSGSLHGHSSHPLHDFAPHSHFNSTVPAVGSSMRYEPPGSSHGTNNTNANPNNASNTTAGGEPSSVSSFSSHISGISSLSGFSNMTTTTSDAYHHVRQTPSPVSVSSQQQADFTTTTASERSRSRSRASTTAGAGAVGADPANPPSTNGGPARRTRTKRNNSVSSVSPPPLQRHAGHAQPLVIPGSAASGRGPASPLSLHTNGWFIPSNGAHGHGHSHGAGEFSLPTPESLHG